MPDREPHSPGTPSQPDVPATGGPAPASSRQTVQTGAVAVAALVFVVGGLAWGAYHLVQQGGTQPASTLQQTPPGSGLREPAPDWPPGQTDTPLPNPIV